MRKTISNVPRHICDQPDAPAIPSGTLGFLEFLLILQIDYFALPLGLGEFLVARTVNDFPSREDSKEPACVGKRSLDDSRAVEDHARHRSAARQLAAGASFGSISFARETRQERLFFARSRASYAPTMLVLEAIWRKLQLRSRNCSRFKGREGR